METSNEWHLMIVGGAFNGRERVFSDDAPVVVGRSHTANVQLPKSDADVSGRHVEFVVIDGIAHVRNLSQTRPVRVNGEDVPMGGASPVRSGDMVELGGRVRIRLDAVPQADGISTAPEAMPDATATAATKFFEGDGSLDVPTAVMEEASVTASGGFGPTVRPPETPTSATRVPDGLTSATRVPDGLTSATRVPDGLTSATRVPDGLTSATHVPTAMLSGDSETETGDGASEDGQTVEGKTRAGSWEEIQAMKDALDRRRKRRRVAIGVALFLVAAALVAVYFLSALPDGGGMAAWPTDENGKPDRRSYVVKGADGFPVLKVIYPGNPNIQEKFLPDNNGVSVFTYYGKRRDIPFFLLFEATRHPDELELDLMASVRRWFAKAKESGEGYVFDERMQQELQPKFFEDAYPGVPVCQIKTLYGIRFLEFEYNRTGIDGKFWHGLAHYFRSGDTVYLLRREIPDFYWERSANLIKQDPNLRIYATFSDAYWESPGKNKLPAKESTNELLAEVQNALENDKERASEWRLIRRDIDGVLARTWRKDPEKRKMAEKCLSKYREALRVYYNGKHFAFLTAKDNKDDKKKQRIRLDVQAIFDEPDERYHFLVNNGEEW